MDRIELEANLSKISAAYAELRLMGTPCLNCAVAAIYKCIDPSCKVGRTAGMVIGSISVCADRSMLRAARDALKRRKVRFMDVIYYMNTQKLIDRSAYVERYSF
jgi:hypothetical protein